LKKVGWSSILVAALVLALGEMAEAQQPTKAPRIGFLGATSSSPVSARTEAFRQRLRELGYVEGKNIVIEARYTDARPEKLPDLAAELVRLKVDIIMAQGGQSIRAAQNATKTIPIVMIAVSIPFRSASWPALRGLGEILPD
jgi:putative ABC transport system substrate-binding protein